MVRDVQVGSGARRRFDEVVTPRTISLVKLKTAWIATQEKRRAYWWAGLYMINPLARLAMYFSTSGRPIIEAQVTVVSSWYACI